MDISQVADVVVRAGDILMGFFNKSHKYIDKSDGSFATEADLESERFLKEELHKLLPEAAFIAEESGNSGNGKYAWVIDPLDGTNNFVHHFPYFAVNVALTLNGVPILGITYNPATKELFSAQQGKGAYLNDQSMRVSDQGDATKAYCSFADPYSKHNSHEFDIVTQKVQHAVRTTRRLGSAALDLAHVASGRFEAAILKYVSWWDIAVGVVLISEAGGKITDFSGDELTYNFTGCIGSNGLFHSDLLGFVSEK